MTSDTIEVAEAKLTSLRSALEDANAEREKVAKAYEAHREPKSYVALQVATDVAADAASAVTAQETVLRRLVHERNSAEQERLRDEAVTAHAAILASCDEATDALIAAVQNFDAVLGKLAAYAQAEMHMRGAQTPSLTRICERASSRFDGVLRPRGEYTDRSTVDARISFESAYGSQHRVRLVFVRSAMSVPTTLF